MGPDLNIRLRSLQFVTIAGLVAGALLTWWALAILKSGMLFWVDGAVFGFTEWLSFSAGIFRFEAFCLLAWTLIDLLRWSQFVVWGDFRAGLISGGSRAIFLSIFSGVIGLLIYLCILSPGEEKEGRRYRSSDLSSALMADDAANYFSPTALEQVEMKSTVSEKGKALADSLVMGQFVTLILVILFWYGVFVRQSLSSVQAAPSVVRTTMYAFYEERSRPRGKEMNKR